MNDPASSEEAQSFTFPPLQKACYQSPVKPSGFLPSDESLASSDRKVDIAQVLSCGNGEIEEELSKVVITEPMENGEGKLDKDVSEEVTTELLEDGRNLEVTSSQEDRGVSLISQQQEVAIDSKATLKIEPDTTSCIIAEVAEGMQNENLEETSESKSIKSVPSSAKQLEETKMNSLPKRLRMTSHQKQELQAVFTKTFYVSGDQKQALAAELGLSNKQVI